MRRTKIVATLGPATGTPERIAQLVAAGLDVARLNFSHGNHDTHAQNVRLVREAAKQAGRPVAIMLDLQGPKIRTGKLENGGPVLLEDGNEFAITTRELVGNAQLVSTTYQELPLDVRPGDRILLSDGLLELRATKVEGDTIHTLVVSGGSLRQNQGINLPGVNVSTPAVTPKDEEDLRFGLEQGVDYIAMSFVRRASDVQRLRAMIDAAGYDIPIIPKIEKPEALGELEEILQLSGGVMVARGDLGVEMSLEQVPIVQKQIIETANALGVPVITATQMLESMIQNPRPTRAEASDVANAIIDGTDAVMLSGETAMGAFPIEAVKTMARIAEVAEASGRYGDHGTVRQALPSAGSVPNAIGEAAAAIVRSLPIKAIIAFTQSGSTARLMAHLRPRAPILGVTTSEKTYQRLSLVWGVTPMQSFEVEDLRDFEAEVRRIVRECDLAHAGDYVVMTGGHPIAAHGQTNFLKVLQID